MQVFIHFPQNFLEPNIGLDGFILQGFQDVLYIIFFSKTLLIEKLEVRAKFKLFR